MRASTAFLLLPLILSACQSEQPRRLEVLFLGHDSRHHDSGTYAPMLKAALAPDGINLTYTTDVASLGEDHLAQFDALIVYANHDSISADQESALLDFVASGGGFLPIHSASYCFRNSDAYVQLVGAQFLSHGVGMFTARIVDAEHPITRQLTPFETWDETYVHTHHASDRHILMERTDSSGHVEPWTWTRTHGKGRVFYTAYGHDERTWQHSEFHALIKAGLLWAIGDKRRASFETLELPPLEYVSHDSIPNYEERNPPPMLQRPLAPEASARHIQVPPGFSLSLFASEPDIINPMAMAWDERGRLFVIQTQDYPNALQPAGEGHDVITIAEDTNGDGRADKFNKFASGLSIPTSLTFARGGVIVSQAPHMLFLKDTDGDDRADVREVLFTGFGTGDTHAGPSNLRYGFDNWIWGTVGYSDFKGVIGGDSVFMPQGVFRFTPGGERFEPIAEFTNNTWGLGFSETFDVFGSTANNEHSVFVAIFNRYYDGVPSLRADGKIKIDGHYAMYPNTPNIRQVDVWGGYTAAAGHNLYTARDFPREYWNRVALINEPTGHLLHKAIMEPWGSGFRERDAWNLLASSDEWVSPVHAEVGPDGAVWILDWYNFVIQHNPTPAGYATGPGNAYVSALRDKAHGRIWRLSYNGAHRTRQPELTRASPDVLVRTLGHDNMFWRLTAQRLLVERGNLDVADALIALVQEQSMDVLGLNSAAVHALWTLHGLHTLNDKSALEAAYSALNHPAAGVRKAALQILPRTAASLDRIVAADLLSDADLNVRLAAMLAVSEMPSSQEAGAQLYTQTRQPGVIDDLWLPEALLIAATRHRTGFMAAYAEDAGEGLGAVGTPAPINWSGVKLDTQDWRRMSLPLPWVRTDDLASFDGVVWFRTEVEVPQAGAALELGLSGIYDSDITWVNGVEVGRTENGYGALRTYTVPAHVLKSGRNVMAVRVDDPRGRGGFWGEPEDMYLRGAGVDISLATLWQYKVEEEYVGGKKSEFSSREPLATQIMRLFAASESTLETMDERVVALSVLPGELRYDRPSFTVAAGERVRLRFTNPGDVPHNVVITVPGGVSMVGPLLDADPEGPYVPDIAEVLYFTDMVDAGGETELVFTAPSEPGNYPFVCTFPGHWRLMQGVMAVE